LISGIERPERPAESFAPALIKETVLFPAESVDYFSRRKRILIKDPTAKARVPSPGHVAAPVLQGQPRMAIGIKKASILAPNPSRNGQFTRFSQEVFENLLIDFVGRLEGNHDRPQLFFLKNSRRRGSLPDIGELQGEIHRIADLSAFALYLRRKREVREV
jgi:hypothetical protein